MDSNEEYITIETNTVKGQEQIRLMRHLVEQINLLLADHFNDYRIAKGVRIELQIPPSGKGEFNLKVFNEEVKSATIEKEIKRLNDPKRLKKLL